MPPEEGTLLYETRSAEKTAFFPASGAARSGSGPVKGERRPKKTAKGPAPLPEDPAPAYPSRSAAPRKREKRSHGLGFALMFVVLLLLAAALAFLLRWGSLDEKGEDKLVSEPERLHLDLGQSLERLLDDESGKYR